MIAIYARQSVERENSISIQTQIEYCKCSIKPDERDIKVNIYKDEGASGGNIDRRGFQDLLEDINNGRVSKVIVYKLDRISRSLNDFVGILQTFKDNNVEFISSQESFDTSSPYGELIVNILMIFAEFERTSIINRVTDAYHARSDLGIYMGGQIPYGFELRPMTAGSVKTNQYMPIPEEVKQIQYVYELYAQDNMVLNKAVQNLVSNNIQPCRGVAWSGSKLSAILKNPIYVKADADVYAYFMKHGTRMVNDIKEYQGIYGARLYGHTKHDCKSNDWSDMKLVLMKHEGIVDSNIWLKCQRKLEKNNQLRRAVSNKTMWLGGLVFCAACGHTMKVTKNSASQTRYFTCSGKQNKKICPGISKTIYVSEFEDMISQSIEEKLSTLNGYKKRIKNDIYPQINDIKLRIQEIEMLESDIVEQLLGNGFDKGFLGIANKKASELKKEKMRLYDRIDELKREEGYIVSSANLLKKWKKADFEEKKAVANILINKVLINMDGTVEIVWNL